MGTTTRNVIGLMSGTSLDGIDLVYVQFDKKNILNFKITHANTVSYSKFWLENLQKSISFTSDRLQFLDLEYGQLLAKEIIFFIEKYQIKNIDFIASHGHTVLHQPENGITLQIGNGQVISNLTQQKVICDFRLQDVKLGGQGAPLVPIGDQLLFSNYDACLNLGGFSNVSFNEGDTRIAFDICPVNIVLNHYVNKLGFSYDDKGQIASTGNINRQLLEQLNALNFYKQSFPKSLGLEWVQDKILPLIDSFQIEVKDILRTFVAHITFQISKSVGHKKNIFITGGGVFNSFLIEKLKECCFAEIIIPESEIIHYKEALIFALLGLLRVDNQVNCLKSVTGASKDHSSGKIFIPK